MYYKAATPGGRRKRFRVFPRSENVLAMLCFEGHVTCHDLGTDRKLQQQND